MMSSNYNQKLSPLENLLKYTEPETVKRLMDFGLWEYKPSTGIFTLSPKSIELLNLNAPLEHNHIDILSESIHALDRKSFTDAFAKAADNKHFFVEVRTAAMAVYNQWLRFEGHKTNYNNGEIIIAGRLACATDDVVIKRIQQQMQTLLTEVIEQKSIRDTLQDICQAFVEVEPAIHCVIFLTSEAADKPLIIHSSELNDELLAVLQSVTLGALQSEYFYTTEKRRPLYIADLHRLKAWHSNKELPNRGLVKTYVGQTIYCNDDQLQGVIALYLPNNELPSEVLETLLTAIHNIASIAIETQLQSDSKNEIKKQLYHSQKMDSIGYLTGGIAHDFNNILGSIVGYNGLADKVAKQLNHDKLTGYIKEVSIAAQRARELIDHMMTYSRAESVEKSIIDPHIVVKEAIQLIRSMIPSSIDIRSSFSSTLPKIQMNPVSLHQIILNHLINAKDAFNNNTGTIEISSFSANNVSFACQSCKKQLQGNYVAIEITDNGAGMSLDIADKIFAPFFTTKGIGEGSGMGLSVVHGLLHDFDSHITLQSEPNVGTKFTLYFPEGVDDTTPELIVDKVLASDKPYFGKGQHIMVVDDDTALSHLMQEILVNNGYKVSRYESGSEAYEIFSKSPDEFEVIVTDQTMPVMTGDVMAQKMMMLRPNLPVIICTGFSEKLTTELAESIGIKRVIKKPIDIKTLLQEISVQLSRKSTS